MLYNNFTWVPVLDTRIIKARDENAKIHHWPVGISEDNNKMICITVRGGLTQPAFPPPLMSNVELQIPLLELGSGTGLLEEKSVFCIRKC